MKIIDRYILKSFIAPFLISFLIAEFVLVIQFLWLRIDDLAGKGLSLFSIMELIFYYAIVMIPMAIPITILISSVMVFGNISEKYELSSMKSAGISLLRVMKYGIILAIGTFLFSLLASNYLKPKAAYKFNAKLLSIRRKKPTVALDEKIFNKDFNGYTIRISEKDKNNHDIRDIKMYNHSKRGNVNFNIISAEEGTMYSSEDDRFFIMSLENGFQYQEKKKSSKNRKKNNYPFIRTEFDEWIKIFDLSEFSMKEENARIFNNKRELMNSIQLMAQIDTSQKRIDRQISRVDPLIMKLGKSGYKPKKNRSTKRKISGIVKQYQTEDLSLYKNFISTVDSNHTGKLMSVAAGYVETTKNRLGSVKNSVAAFNRTRSYYMLGLHQQYSWAVICIIFLFIGASMGSIIRKGGFGFPILFAIFFFMSFIILSIMGDKLSRGSSTLDPITAAWLPIFVLAPLSVFLTRKAIKDSKLMNIKFLSGLFKKSEDA